jgi:hypothetical protein
MRQDAFSRAGRHCPGRALESAAASTIADCGSEAASALLALVAELYAELEKLRKEVSRLRLAVRQTQKWTW